MRLWFKRRKQDIKSSNGTSFYFFDFDDNIMFLSTPIFVRNKDTQEIIAKSTTEFATIDLDQFETFDGTYKNFHDIPDDELQPGQEQYFVEDVGKADLPVIQTDGFPDDGVLERILEIKYEFGIVRWGCYYWRSGESRCFTEE